MSEESPLAKPQGYEPCEECGAPLDPQQRYCVECAARRGNGSNPASRYFAAMSKKSRRPLTKGQAKGAGGGSRAAAVGFFALLPIAVALGVVVGRSGSGDSNEEALLKALHQAETAAGRGGAGRTKKTAPTASTTKAAKAAKGAKKGDKAAAKNAAKKAAKSAGQSAEQDQERHRPRSHRLQTDQGRPKKPTPNWSKKTPNRRAKTTSRPSRICPT